MALDANREAVERFWRALEKPDREAAATELDEDVVEEWPQSGERIRGAGNWLRMATQHPTFPAIKLTRIRGNADFWAVEADYDYGDGIPWRIVGLHELRDARIVHLTEVFGAPFEAAGWRKDIVERM